MRLEIMQRDNFACRQCERRDLTLHVHHTCYERGRFPWEYPPHLLVTLCEPCHDMEEAEKNAHDAALVHALRRLGATNLQLYGLQLEIEAAAAHFGGAAALSVIRRAIDETMPEHARV